MPTPASIFHTAYQETGWPTKGYEVQINNTCLGHGNYRELKRTGSLYGVRNVTKSASATTSGSACASA